MRYVCAFVLLSLLLTGCSSKGTAANSPAASEAAQASAGDAKEFAEGKEARAWLGDANHVFFKVSKEAVGNLTTALYSAGAPEVRVAALDTVTDDSIPALKGKTFAGSLVVQLPQDAAKRKAVFAAINKQESDAGDEATKDTGQQYYGFGLD